MNIFVRYLTRSYRLIKFFGIITGVHYSLFNISDDDSRIETTADKLFHKNNPYNNPDIHDVFHRKSFLGKIIMVYKSR